MCHPREGGDPDLEMITKTHLCDSAALSVWFPAFAGMTTFFVSLIRSTLRLKRDFTVLTATSLTHYFTLLKSPANTDDSWAGLTYFLSTASKSALVSFAIADSMSPTNA